MMGGIGPRLFAPEIDAANALASSNAGAAMPAYTLVAGGTGPAPLHAATGNTTLGRTIGEGRGGCPPGYMADPEGNCVSTTPPRRGPDKPTGTPPTVTPPTPPMSPPVSMPPVLPPEGSQPPVYTAPPAPINPPTQAPPYYQPPAPMQPPPDMEPCSPDFQACAGDCTLSCAADRNDF
jgi:hypothetical protein